MIFKEELKHNYQRISKSDVLFYLFLIYFTHLKVCGGLLEDHSLFIYDNFINRPGHWCIKSIFNGFAIAIHCTLKVVPFGFCSVQVMPLIKISIWLHLVTNICLSATCGLFLGIQAYLRLIYIPHSHQALKLQCGLAGLFYKHLYNSLINSVSHPSLQHRKSWGDDILRECSLLTMCHVSHVTFHVSPGKYHVSHVKCTIFFFFFLFLDKVVKLIGGGSVINRTYPVLFLDNTYKIAFSYYEFTI